MVLYGKTYAKSVQWPVDSPKSIIYKPPCCFQPSIICFFHETQDFNIVSFTLYLYALFKELHNNSSEILFLSSTGI